MQDKQKSGGHAPSFRSLEFFNRGKQDKAQPIELQQMIWWFNRVLLRLAVFLFSGVEWKKRE